MPITERTLKRWRKEALEKIDHWKDEGLDTNVSETIEYQKRILRMTQELLDLHLIRKK